MGWLIFGGILTLLALLPLGVLVQYEEAGVLVKLRCGPVVIPVFPRKKPKKQEPKAAPEEKAPNLEKKAAPQPVSQPKPPKEAKGGSVLDFLPLVRTGLEFLNTLRRKLRVEQLYLRLTMAANDPADLAIQYGRAWAALGNLMPALERFLVIKKKDMDIACDFAGGQTLVIARVEITITLGRLLALAVVYGLRVWKEYLHIQKLRKGGTVQ